MADSNEDRDKSTTADPQVDPQLVDDLFAVVDAHGLTAALTAVGGIPTLTAFAEALTWSARGQQPVSDPADLHPDVADVEALASAINDGQALLATLDRVLRQLPPTGDRPPGDPLGFPRP